MSTDLQWLLLRNSNSFIVKRPYETRTFSKEPGNLRNLHSQKFSGLANAKTVNIATSPAGGIQITTRKTKAPASAISKAYSTTNIRPRSGTRRALGITATVVAKRGYRADLRTAALARTSALLASQKEPKAAPPKKARGRKAKAAAAEEEA